MRQLIRGEDEPLEEFLQALLGLAGPDRQREIVYDSSTRTADVPDDVADAYMAGDNGPETAEEPASKPAKRARKAAAITDEPQE